MRDARFIKIALIPTITEPSSTNHVVDVVVDLTAAHTEVLSETVDEVMTGPSTPALAVDSRSAAC